MPELPEVETMCRGLRPIVGSRVDAAGRSPCKRRPNRIVPRVDVIQKRILGQSIESISRWGKKLLLHFSNGDCLVIEPRMTGLVLIENPPTREHFRYELQLSGKFQGKLQFWDRRGLGTIYLLSAMELAAQKQRGRLGPDALEISVPEFRQRLNPERRPSQRPIKVALLDQAKVAGIGNLYASEMLFVARIDPRLPCCQLTSRQWSRLHAAMLEILQQAIEHEGSTLSDGTYRNALNKSGSYQNCHQVYDRAGDTCLGCGRDQILRIVQAQRSTFYCPRCQG